MRIESAAEWCRNNLIDVGDPLEVFIGFKRSPITAGWVICQLAYRGNRMIIVERDCSEVELARTSPRSLRTPVL